MTELDKVEYHRLRDSSEVMLSQGAYSDFAFKPHYHIDFHIGMVLSGVQEQKFKGKKVLLGPGRISIMPPGEIHDGTNYQKNAYQMNTFRLSPNLVQQFFGDIFELNSLPDFGGEMIEDKRLSQQLILLFNTMKKEKEISNISVEEQCLSSLHPLLNMLTKKSSPQINGALSAKHLKWVVEYCHANLGQKISLNQLSDITDLNRYQFLRRFEKSVGLTPHKWLTQLRLEHACRQLRTSDRSIVDIATGVGFYDQSHFNRAFKNLYGVAPSSY